MKYLRLFEDFNLEQRLKLERKLKRFGIKDYIINSDGTIDANQSVTFSNLNIVKMPFKFGKINGNFDCSYNRIKSLEGCPKEVTGNFYCNGNQLASLKYCPIKIGKNFSCAKNSLETLEFGPEEVGGNFDCRQNQLISLKHCPVEIGGNLECVLNKLTKLDTISNIEGDIHCWHNKIDPNNSGFDGWCSGEIKY